MKRFLACAFILSITGCFSHDHDSHDHTHDHSNHDHHAHHDDHNGSGIHHHHSHDNLGAHVHGEMDMSIAVEGRNIFFEISGASDGMLGFEHEPKTEEQTEAWNSLRSYWSRSNTMDVFSFDQSINCHGHSSEVQMLIPEGGGHSNLLIQGQIMCNSDVSGLKLQSGFLDHFQRLHKLNIEVLADSVDPYTLTITSSDQFDFQL